MEACAAEGVKTQQRIQRALIVCLLLLLLAACSVQSSSQQLANATLVATSGEPVRLVLWQAWTPELQPVMSNLVNQYHRTQSNVRIIVQSVPRASLSKDMRTATLAGGGPHLLLIPSHSLGALSDQLLPLDELVPATKESVLLPVTVASGRATNGAGESLQYGVPVTFDTLVLYYNKANVLDPPANTERLLSASRGLTDISTQPPIWGLAYNLSLDTTIGYLYAFGGRVFDDTGRVVLGGEGRAGTERWLQWLLDLHQDNQLLAVTDGIRVDGALKAHQALMTVNWANQYGSYRALWGDKLGVAPLPQLSATGNAPVTYVQTEVISVNGLVRDVEEQRAAADFIGYIVSTEAQQELLRAGLQPVNSDLQLDGPDYEAARAFRSQAEQSVAMPNSINDTDVVWPTLTQMLRAVLQRQLSPADAVTEADLRLRQRFEPASTP